MINHILFIIPGTKIGGTLSSFISIYNALNDHCNIKVLPLFNCDVDGLPFSKSLISNSLLNAYNGPFSSLSVYEKLLALFVKPYKRYLLTRNDQLSSIVARKVVKQISQKQRFDVVVGFSEGISTKLASFFNESKRVSWIHCDYKRYFEDVINRRDESKTYNKHDTIVCVSDYTRNSFISIYPVLAHKTVYIYNLLDIKRIKMMSETVPDDKCFVNDRFTIISVGRIDPVKRFSEIPIIASKLKQTGFCFRWYILGPNGDSQEASLLQRRIVDLDVEDDVLWLGEKPNPYTYMSRSDLYVCLSSSEACPMVFNEAKVIGLPIVTTDFGSAYEFIMPGKNGIITTLKDMSSAILDYASGRLVLGGLQESSYLYDNNNLIKKLNSVFS